MMDYIIYILFILTIIYFLVRFINLLRYESKYKNINIDASGCEIAQKLLDTNNIKNTYVIETKNSFEQGYNYGRDVVKLLPNNFNDTNIISIVNSCYETMKIVGEKDNKLFKVRNRLQYTIDILSILNVIAIIVSLILRDFYILKISISTFFIIILLNYIFTLTIKENIRKLNEFITTEIGNNYNDLLESYIYYYSVQPFRAIIKLIIFIKAK